MSSHEPSGRAWAADGAEDARKAARRSTFRSTPIAGRAWMSWKLSSRSDARAARGSSTFARGTTEARLTAATAVVARRVGPRERDTKRARRAASITGTRCVPVGPTSAGSLVGSLLSYALGYYAGKPTILKVGKYLLFQFFINVLA